MIIAAAAVLAPLGAHRLEANVVTPLSEAAAIKAADLAVVADVLETNVTVTSAYRTVSHDERGDIHVDGFRNPCIRARVVEQRKGRSASTILVCTLLHNEGSQLPPQGRRVSMFLQQAGEVWLEVLGAGFREIQPR